MFQVSIRIVQADSNCCDHESLETVKGVLVHLPSMTHTLPPFYPRDSSSEDRKILSPVEIYYVSCVRRDISTRLHENSRENFHSIAVSNMYVLYLRSGRIRAGRDTTEGLKGFIEE